MKKRYIVLTIIAMLLLLLYYFLGGFKIIEKEVVKNPEVKILGTYYKGKINSDLLKDLFMEAKTVVETAENATKIAIVYFGEANPDTGEVSNFIGVSVKGEINYSIPQDWQYMRFSAANSVKGCIEANVLVMPTPDDMLQQLKTYAVENDVLTDSIFIEYYSGPNNLCVQLLGEKLQTEN